LKMMNQMQFAWASISSAALRGIILVLKYCTRPAHTHTHYDVSGAHRSHTHVSAVRALQNAMVQDMVGILNCRQRFLARYGQQQPGQKLPTQTARKLQASLGKDDEALQRKRVEAELKHRGGFLPLMGHYPVAKYGVASSSSSSSSSSSLVHTGDAVAGMAQVESPAAADEVVPQPTAADRAPTAAAVAVSSSGTGGVPFSERDKRTCLFVQHYLQQQRKLVAAKRRKQQRRQPGGAHQAGHQGLQAQQQSGAPMPMEV
jgi:hypothetical protein